MRGSPSRGVTLIEAIVALVILTAAFVAALEARVGLLRATSGLDERQRTARLQQGVFDELIAGTLVGASEIVDGRELRTGTYLDEDYRVVIAPALVPNPVEGLVGYDVPDRVAVLRYTIEIAGSTETFLWHRR